MAQHQHGSSLNYHSPIRGRSKTRLPVPTKSEGESGPDSPARYPTPHWSLGVERFPGWRVTRAERNNASPRASKRQAGQHFLCLQRPTIRYAGHFGRCFIYLYNHLSIARSPQKLACLVLSCLVLLCVSPIIVVTFLFVLFFFSFAGCWVAC